MTTEFAALQRERETSVQPLKKTTANGTTYSRDGTAELKPYSRSAKKNRIGCPLRCFDSFSNSLGKSSRGILNKSSIYIFSQKIFSPLPRNGIGVGQQRSILKIQKLIQVVS